MFSDEEVFRELGRSLTSTEAADIARRLGESYPLTSALAGLSPARKAELKPLLKPMADAADGLGRLIGALWAVAAAREIRTRVEPLWTMPGHVAQHGALTSSVVDLVDGARMSVVCSTFNFQTTSGLWHALERACDRASVEVCVYVDRDASNKGASGPTPSEVASHLPRARVFATTMHDGKYVVNHAKFVSVDHRFVIITSANFSWSAENHNVELGVRIDDPALAAAIEREIGAAQKVCYEEVQP